MGSLFKKKAHEPKCEYCLKAKIPLDRSEALCKYNGVMPLDGKCKKFEYDPLKRVPKKVRLDTDFSPEDFKL